MSEFELVEAKPAHSLPVRSLIMQILNEEYALSVRLSELPDLVNVYESYCRTGPGNFWVALRNERVCGCIGLMHVGRGDFELQRMYVEASARGHGLGQKLLDILLTWAIENGVKSIYLETNHRWHAARHIYEKNGFLPVSKEDLPPEFRVVRAANGFYRLPLSNDEVAAMGG
jgi:N-acetylglutamate synthase-like GNAT family acetyltransferase